MPNPYTFTSIPDRTANTDPNSAADFNAAKENTDYLKYEVENLPTPAVAFTDLSDVPASYSGQAGKIPAVNVGETALEFISPPAGAEAFTDLSDAPSSYSGQSLKNVRVNTGETALEFVTPPTIPDAFTDLSDVPSSYSGQGGKVVAVNSGGTALEFIAASSGGGSDGVSFTMMGNAYVAENIMMMRIAKARTISKVIIGVTAAPTGANLIVDVNYHASDPSSATTIFTTQANRPEIAASSKTDDSGTPDVTSVAAGGFLLFSIDQIGSTIAGANLMVTVVF